MLEHVEHHDDVCGVPLHLEVLDGSLLQTNAESSGALVDGPCRWLDAVLLPSPFGGDLQEQANVGADLQQPPARDGEAGYLAKDPREQLASCRLRIEVDLVHHLDVAIDDLLWVERRDRRDHSTPRALHDVV